MIGASVLGRKPTRLELSLANVVPRLFGLRGFKEGHRSDPEVYCWFLSELCAAWMFLYVGYGLTVLGVWGALHALKLVGNLGAPVWEVGAGFCVVGIWDAGLRAFPAWTARRRYLREGRTLDANGRRMMKLALANDATILLQIAGGILFALYG